MLDDISLLSLISDIKDSKSMENAIEVHNHKLVASFDTKYKMIRFTDISPKSPPVLPWCFKANLIKAWAYLSWVMKCFLSGS